VSDRTDDEASTSGRPTSSSDRAPTSGVAALAVSLAEEGLLLVTRDAIEYVHAPGVKMVSAVGAGDSTVAGIVVELDHGAATADATVFGVAAGTAAVLTPGTDLAAREDVDRIAAQIRAART